MQIMKTALALSVLMLAPVICAQDLAGPLRQGMVEEDANRNLDAAIRNYQSVLTRFAEERKTAATALFRLAECYRKQGNTQQANAAYSRLVAEFADQTQLAAQSRKALGKPAEAAQKTAAPATPSPLSTEARLIQLQALQERRTIAYQQLQQTQKQLELGVVAFEDARDAELGVAKAERALAEFEGRRDDVRKFLWQQVTIAEKALAEEEKRYQLGLVSTTEVNRRRLAVIDLRAEYATQAAK